MWEYNPNYRICQNVQLLKWNALKTVKKTFFTTSILQMHKYSKIIYKNKIALPILEYENRQSEKSNSDKLYFPAKMEASSSTIAIVVFHTLHLILTEQKLIGYFHSWGNNE